MVLSADGKLKEGVDITPGAQTAYDIRVQFLKDPIKVYQEYVDLYELNKDDKMLAMLALDNVKKVLLLDRYDKDFVYPLFDQTRLKLFNYFESRLG